MQAYSRPFVLIAVALFVSVLAVLLVAAPRDVHRRANDAQRSAPNEDPPGSPITFADPDGQELILEELSARTAIHGMLSLTELELRFRNPQNRRIEGRFTCTLPPDAAISRFAKEVNGALMEGEVVERLRANQVYEQFLHQMRDPALLEQDQGNRFSARIFPIEANAPVRLLVSYTQLLPMRGGVRRYTLPLRGLPKVNTLTFRGFVTPVPGETAPGTLSRSTVDVTSFEQRDWTPDRDIELTWRAGQDAPRARVLRAGDFYLAALRPPVPVAKAATAHDWLVYVDTSASSAEGAAHRTQAIGQILAALPAGDRVELVAFDQEIVPLGRGTAAEMARRAAGRLGERLFLGGTDLGALFADVARRLRGDASRTVVIASDLVPTLGGTASNDVNDAITAIPAHARIHALVLGSRENAPVAHALTAGRGRIVRVPFTESLVARARDAADELRRPLGASFDARDPGAEWMSPAHFDDVGAGDEILVLGKVKAGAEPRVTLSRMPEVSAVANRLDASTFGPLLEREAYRAYLDHLAKREANEASEGVRRALANEQVRVSVEQRVVIPRTTMLVLESEWDYQRFQLDRRALAEILTIDVGGIGRLDRRTRVPPSPVEMAREKPAAMMVPPPETTIDDSFEEPEGEDAPAVQGRVEGDVLGGVAGGVHGGVVGGMIGVAPNVQTSVAEAITVAEAPAPPPPPRRVARDDQPSRERGWTRRAKPDRAQMLDLERQLRAEPRDRERYNQLSEMLAAHGEWSSLRRLALEWQPYDPENPQVYEVLGMAAEGLGRESEAARAYASLIEIAPAKPELLQRAGLLLLRGGRARLAETPLRRALELRPDRANSYRHLGLMLWREGRLEEAARVMESATQQTFPNWYGGVQRVIREELGYVYRAWRKKDPSRAAEIADRAREHDVDLDRRDALRITLAWETDANDVDLHVVDPAGEECFYGNAKTRSGLTLYEDITQGLGPEVIRTGSLKDGTYHIGVHYFAAGPMGISRGVIVVVRDDDTVEIHPFRLAAGGEPVRYIAELK